MKSYDVLVQLVRAMHDLQRVTVPALTTRANSSSVMQTVLLVNMSKCCCGQPSDVVCYSS